MRGTEGDAWIWSVRAGELLHTLDQHDSGPVFAEFSLDGRLVVTGGDLEDRSVRSWDAETGECVQVFEKLAGWRGWFNRVTKRVVLPEKDWYALYDAETGELLRHLERLGAALPHVAKNELQLAFNAMEFSPDGRYFVAGIDGTSVAAVFDGRTGALHCLIDGTEKEFFGRGQAFSADGRRLVLRGEESVSVWDPASGERLARWDVGIGTYVAADADGSRVMAGQLDGAYLVWDVGEPEPVHTLETDSATPWVVALSPDGTRAYTTGTDSTVRVWAPRTGRDRTTLTGNVGGVMRLAFSPDGSRVASADGIGLAHVWNRRTRERVEIRAHWVERESKKAANYVTDVEFSPDGRWLLTAGVNSRAWINDAATGEAIRTFDHDYILWSARFSPDGRRVLTASEDGTASLWDAGSGDLLARFGDPKPRSSNVLIGSTDARFSPDGTRVLTRLRDDFARVWHAETHALVRELGGHATNLQHASFSADGRLIVTSGFETSRIWDAATGELLRTVEGGTIAQRSPLSPDGRRLVVGWMSEAARIVDTVTGDVVLTLPRRGAVTYTEFSPDGKLLLVGSAGETALVDVDSCTVLMSLDLRTAPCFSPDSASVAGADAHVRVKRIRIYPTDPLAEAITRKPRELTDVERERYGIPANRDR
jgi:WD40 repeat protein